LLDRRRDLQRQGVEAIDQLVEQAHPAAIEVEA
jgi:hypothetical protein